ncbi:hypothetical protein GCM10027575_44300 [Phytohabitans suffuscus]
MIGAPPDRGADGFAQRVLLVTGYVVDLDVASSVHDHVGSELGDEREPVVGFGLREMAVDQGKAAPAGWDVRYVTVPANCAAVASYHDSPHPSAECRVARGNLTPGLPQIRT